jgi:hypothetical protein
MSTSKSTIIGPYLKIDGVHILNIPKIKRVCPTHQKETKDKYCSLCGKEVENVEYTETKKLSGIDFYNQSKMNGEDRLYVADYCNVVLPNKSYPNMIRVDSYDNDVIDLTDCASLIQEQIDWFKKEYVNEIAIFIEAFGETNVSVKWGVATYWS